MTITRHSTQRGNVIHLVSFSDLVDAVQSGERLRASCPIHGSDHQRSLSIDCGTGWGFCHSCHATVLVQPSASVIASGQGNRCGQRSAHGGFGDESKRSTSACALGAPIPAYDGCITATSLPHWQQEEVALSELLLP